MGIWQKTLFYLGLVDEDDPASYGGAAPVQSRHGAMERGGTPAVRAGRADLPTDPGPGRAEVAVRRNPARRIEPPDASRSVQGRRVEPPSAGRRRTTADGALAEAGVVIRPHDTPLVRTVSDTDLESEVIVATSYSDAQLLADHIRSTIPVVLDLRKVEPAMVRRLVDFASGLTYALGGSMRKIGQGVILVTPANVNLSRDERRRLKELGYYEAPEEG